MPAETLSMLLGAAWLLPLASFTAIVLFGPRMGKHGVLASYVATGAILASLVLSLCALGFWLNKHGVPTISHGEHAAGHAPSAHPHEHAAGAEADHAAHLALPPVSYSGDWYTLGQFGKLRITIGYYIDALTVAMFSMVSLIATLIHFYAIGYMHDELHEVTDHEVTLSDGHHLHRPGRFHRFFQYLSLFCFSMLGLVVAGNIAMVFVFWELVGICSYFLIGFYIERRSACVAANKAFIVNRVGDFGMIIGLMALWGSLGTFHFGDWKDDEGATHAGLFSQVRSPQNDYKLAPPQGMMLTAGRAEVARIVDDHRDDSGFRDLGAASQIAYASGEPEWHEKYNRPAYWLLVIAGLGIFCGCVGKSAQFPLHVWLPDAMEGPTPVSALVHSATMVAAGVYLVGRFYPVFAPEVLLTIAYIGCITLFLAATIAITAVDIKRVLAYSTVSQLGYMFRL
jgi:NADH-quinone oxidoreductase subunit L